MNQLTVRSVFSDAWSLLDGSKLAIWGVGSLIMLIAITVQWLFNEMLGNNFQHTHYLAQHIILPIVTGLLIAPFYGGGMMTAIKRARGESVDIKSGYQYLHFYVPITITVIIVGFVSSLVTMMINIPPIAQALGHWLALFDLIAALYSLLAYVFLILSIPLVIDKRYTPGQALSGAFLRVRPHWSTIFGVFLLTYLCLFAAILPMLLGLMFKNGLLMLIGATIFLVALVWLLPFLFMLIGVIYHRLVDQ